jgi:hypothetical protein
LKNICLHEFSQCDQNTWNAYGTLQVIDDFVQFCRLLSKPENHVKTRSSQYIEKLVNSRTFIDMNHEMAHELIKLPRYTAYAKIIEERGGDQTVIAPKFRAQKPPSVPHGRNRDIRDRALELTHSFYCKERTQIEEELRHRQKNWRKRSATEGTPANKHSPPASAEAERQQAKERNVPPAMKPEEPPPTYSRDEGRPTAPEEPSSAR